VITHILMQSGDRCGIYNSDYHLEWCEFSYGSGSAIWSNGDNCADLRDGQGKTIDPYCY
jgi:hypothetical protein